MRISRLELINYKCFEHIALENLGDRIVLVGPNGCGKSSILEALAVFKEYVGSYYTSDLKYHQELPVVGSKLKAWNIKVPLPIRGYETAATINVTLSFNEHERAFVGCAESESLSIKIDRNGEVKVNADNVTMQSVSTLLKHFDPNSNIGAFDYIGSERRYPPQKLTNLDLGVLSVHKQREERIEIFANALPTEKFSTVKHFIVSQQMNDYSVFKSTGEDRDSISLLKEIFTNFFGPKILIGMMQQNGEITVTVRTPNGDHDIDQLSSGEKELFMVFVNLFRIRNMPSVILYDEPERHLNPGLESKIIPALDNLNTKNQLWIATHATELIGSVPMQEIIALNRNAGSSQPERFLESTATDRIRLFESIGARIGLQLSSSRIVFLEGNKSSVDKKILDRLVGLILPDVLFVASGGTDEVLGTGTRAGMLIEEASSDATFLMVLDRDFRRIDQVEDLRRRLNDRVFIWSCHEAENLLIIPEVLLTVLKSNGVGSISSIDKVKSELKEIAQSLSEQIAYLWAAYQIKYNVNVSSSGRPNTEENYLRMVAGQLDRSVRSYSVEAAQAALSQARADIAKCFSDDTWMSVLPGKEILNAFRQKYLNTLPDDMFVEQIVYHTIEMRTIPSQIQELCAFIESK